MRTHIEEHKKAVMKADPNNAIACSTCGAQDTGSSGMRQAWTVMWTGIERRRIKEALHVRSSSITINPDHGLSLNPCWTATRQPPIIMTGTDVVMATI